MARAMKSWLAEFETRSASTGTATRQLWFTDNGRDWMGDNQPPDELNHAPTEGLNFGYPHCHGIAIADPEFGKQRPCSHFRAPVLEPEGRMSRRSACGSTPVYVSAGVSRPHFYRRARVLESHRQDRLPYYARIPFAGWTVAETQPSPKDGAHRAVALGGVRSTFLDARWFLVSVGR